MGGNPVDIVMINLAREVTRWSEDQRGESASSKSSLGGSSTSCRKRTYSGGGDVRRFWGRTDTLDRGRGVRG